MEKLDNRFVLTSGIGIGILLGGIVAAIGMPLWFQIVLPIFIVFMACYFDYKEKTFNIK